LSSQAKVILLPVLRCVNVVPGPNIRAAARVAWKGLRQCHAIALLRDLERSVVKTEAIRPHIEIGVSEPIGMGGVPGMGSLQGEPDRVRLRPRPRHALLPGPPSQAYGQATPFVNHWPGSAVPWKVRRPAALVADIGVDNRWVGASLGTNVQ